MPTPADTPPDTCAPDAALRLRFWVGGGLRDEIWFDATDAESADLAQRAATWHAHLASLADAAGIPWLTEVYDPAAPADEAYLRFGTDLAGMVAPVPAPRGWRM